MAWKGHFASRTSSSARTHTAPTHTHAHATHPVAGGSPKRQGGGIEPLHVSMPRELKSRPSTSPTHPGSFRNLLGRSHHLTFPGCTCFPAITSRSCWLAPSGHFCSCPPSALTPNEGRKPFKHSLCWGCVLPAARLGPKEADDATCKSPSWCLCHRCRTPGA